MRTAVCLVEGEPPIPLAGATAIRHTLGIEQVRIGIDDAVWNPEERVYDISGKTAQDIYTLNQAGLLVHANMSWCAPWKAGGSIWMRPYTQGCGRYVDTHDPVDPAKYGGGWEFADDRDYCINPTHISAKWMRRSGEFFGEWFSRSAQLLYAVSCGNEPDGEIYNAVLHAHGQDEAFDRYANEYAYQFLSGIRTAVMAPFIEHPLIVGPEAAGGDGLRRMLEWALKIGLPLDVISAHGYDDDEYPGFPDGALARWEKEFLPQVEMYRRESGWQVPTWNTECGQNKNTAPTAKGIEKYLAGMQQLGVEVVTWNNVKQLFVDWDKGNYAPTDIGLVFSDYNAAETARRRAVIV